ncbi:hypothetical protein [Cryobacterium melibiosiphilum]|uniref:hypothetical protein n=1 Tax=Cryobacterium melibiosiphilum TaxID=995039 RepID=UPI0011C2211E|nr:hypothetical protein [Cryobacterium melibiosiphilum]
MDGLFASAFSLGAPIRKTFAVISMAVLGLMLSACAAVSPAAPDPIDPLSSASAPTDIIIGAENTDIVDVSGNVLVTLTYSEDGDAAVAAAVGILGEPTEVRHQDRTNHYPEVDGTSWGGFDIVVNRYPAEALLTGEARFYQPAFSVQATAATTDADVAVTAVDLTRVGDDFDLAAEGQPANRVHTDDAFGIRSVAIDLPTSFSGIIDDAGIEMTYGAIANAVPDSSTVTQIVAPAYLFSLS